MCSACKNCGKVFDPFQRLLTGFWFDAANDDPMFLLVQGDENPQSVTIRVTFCPWCGEKLTERKDKHALPADRK